MTEQPGRQNRTGLALRLVGLPTNMKAAPYAALFLRLWLAAFFMAHLYRKFFDVPLGGFSGWWHALNHRYPPIVPIYVLTVEFGCAILLPLGLATRLVALYALPSMAAIVLFWIRLKGWWFTSSGAEFSAMWLCALVLQVILGDGACSIGIARPRG